MQTEHESGRRHGRPQPGSGKALRRATGYLRSYWKDTVGALIALLLVSVANLAVPLVIRLAIDQGMTDHDGRLIAYSVMALLVLALARGLFTFLQGYLAERASQGVAYDLREGLFAKIERLSFSYFDRSQTGQLISRMTNDVEQVRVFTGSGIIQICSSIIMLFGTAALLLVLNWQLALVELTTIPLILVTLFLLIRAIGPMFGQLQHAIGGINMVLQEDLVGMRVIRSFGQEKRERARYDTANQRVLDLNLRALFAFAGHFPLIFFVANVGIIAVVWYGGMHVIDGNLTVGDLVAFTTYIGFLLLPIMTIGFQSTIISRAGASALRVFEVLDEPEELVSRPEAVVLPPLHGRVELRDVHFRYPGSEREILSGISLTIEAGQTVAIIGTTGSGKSSLVGLIPRFYDVTHGAVLIDGHDVRDVTLASLRSQIGIVLQESLLFSGTIRENIAYGRPDASDEEIIRVARAAQAEEFILSLPQGYDTLVGERGLGLSGGQRQRLAIARALLVDPRLLILDDSTSAVDTRTEAAIQQALDELIHQGRRTVVIIAQRISTVRAADMIVILDHGQVAATGTHAELLRDNPLYNEIIQSQLLDDLSDVNVVSGGVA